MNKEGEVKKDNGVPGHDKEQSQENPKDHQAGAHHESSCVKRIEFDALWNKYMRTCADFENARKRWDREREETLKFGNVMLLRDLLVILDEMAQALKIVQEHKNSDEIVKGLEMMYSNFYGTLKKRGLAVIETAGRKFDPHYHEIVATREIETTEDHMIIEEVQRGYLLDDKVLRASKVIVGVKKQSSDQDSAPQVDTQEKGPCE